MWLRSPEEQLVFLLPDVLPGEQGLWVERADTGCRQFLFPLPAPQQLGVEWQEARNRRVHLRRWAPPPAALVSSKTHCGGWPPVSDLRCSNQYEILCPPIRRQILNFLSPITFAGDEK